MVVFLPRTPAAGEWSKFEVYTPNNFCTLCERFNPREFCALRACMLAFPTQMKRVQISSATSALWCRKLESVHEPGSCFQIPRTQSKSFRVSLKTAWLSILGAPEARADNFRCVCKFEEKCLVWLQICRVWIHEPGSCISDDLPRQILLRTGTGTGTGKRDIASRSIFA